MSPSQIILTDTEGPVTDELTTEQTRGMGKDSWATLAEWRQLRDCQPVTKMEKTKRKRFGRERGRWSLTVPFAGPAEMLWSHQRTRFRVRLTPGDRNVIFHVERLGKITRRRQRGGGDRGLNLGFPSI